MLIWFGAVQIVVTPMVFNPFAKALWQIRGAARC
jgi:hypothetical protein